MAAPLPSLDKNAVYWLDVGAGPPSIIGDVEFRPQPSHLCFYDTARPHALDARFVSGNTKTGFTFQSPSGPLVVRPLDLAAFEKVFRNAIPTAPRFTSDAAVQDFYRDLIRSVS